MPQKKNAAKHGWLLKAYNNYEFLNSAPARNIRILSEMMEPADRLRRQNIRNTVVFFGSARTLPRNVALKRLKKVEHQVARRRSLSKNLQQELEYADRDLKMSQYYEDAAKLSRKLTLWFNQRENADKNFRICSGGGPGIMEAANRGAKSAGGKSIGLNISLPHEQAPNVYQTREISFEFHYFFIRKFWFFYLAKGLVIFPGGFGTFDEFFELLTLVQTKKAKKYMPVVLYGSEYWNDVLNFHNMAKWGTISLEDLNLFKIVDTVDSAFDYLKAELDKHYFKYRGPR